MIDSSKYSIKIIRGFYCLVKKVEDCYPVEYFIVTKDIIEQPIKQLYFEICTGYYETTYELENMIWARNIARGNTL